MYKVVFGTVGAIAGGIIGFIIALFGVALFFPNHALLYGAHGVFGVPFGAIAGCVFGVKVTDRTVEKLSAIDRRLPMLLTFLLLFCVAIWFFMEFTNRW